MSGLWSAIGAARTFGPGVVSSRKCKLPDPISADTEDQDREWRAGAVGSPAHEGRTAVSDNRDFTCGRLSDDSAVEQRGFEPLFPHKNGWRVLTALIDLKALLLRENRANRARGIDGSNLASSSGESSANPISWREKVLGFSREWADGTNWQPLARDDVRIMNGHCPDALSPAGNRRPQ
jgi:hypothetical protein